MEKLLLLIGNVLEITILVGLIFSVLKLRSKNKDLERSCERLFEAYFDISDKNEILKQKLEAQKSLSKTLNGIINDKNESKI